MTLAPERAVSAARSPGTTVTVTAVLLLPPKLSREPARTPSADEQNAPTASALDRLLAALSTTLDALAGQTRLPERLVVVVPTPDPRVLELVEQHRIRRSVSVTTTQVPTGERVAGSVAAALDATPHGETPGAAEHLWFLTADSDADPDALDLMVRSLRGSDSAGIAGPKLVQWRNTGRLQAVGVQLTRTGRLIPTPPPGQPDQGQYDRRADVLAVPVAGMLVERELFRSLGGFDPTLATDAASVDLSWRAHLAGRRVVVVPRAVIATADPDLSAPADRRRLQGRVRRQTRRVALTRCSILLAPLLAAWVLLSSAVAAVALLLGKRPRAAWSELADAGAIVNPWRTLSARFRFRVRRGGQIHRRHLRGLFASSRASVLASLDLLQDVVLPESGSGEELQAAGTAEPGPVDEEAQDLNLMTTSLVTRVVRNPGVLASLVTLGVVLAAARTWGGSLLDGLRSGLVGGELVAGRADSATLWHAWLDGWHGGGLGSSAVAGPHLPVVAAVAWVLEHLPLLDTRGSSASMAVAVLLVLSLPLASVTAYVAGRVITHQRWPRALAALAWAGAATATTTVGGGRIGPAVALVVLPLAAAGLARSAQQEGTATASFAGALAATVAAAFLPLVLPLVLLFGLVQLVAGRGSMRWRGLPVVLLPLALLGPWLADLVSDPLLLLSGPGVAQWGPATAQPWEMALLHPGGPGSYPVLLAVPLLAAAVVGLVRRGRGAARWSLGLLAVVGLVGAVLAPTVVLAEVPAGRPSGGAVVTLWSGAPLLLLSLAVCALALMALDDLPLTRTRGGWAAVARIPGVAFVAAGVLASLALPAWHGLGGAVSAWSDPRPAVAIDQAEGPLSNRMLVLTPSDGEVALRVISREVTDVARALPTPSEPIEPGLARSVSGILTPAGSSAEVPATGLADLGIGFIGLDADDSSPLVGTLDATAGLSRMGSKDGVIHWRILAAADGVSGPPRLRLVDDAGSETTPEKDAGANPATADGATFRAVPVTGDHATTTARVTTGAGTTLVVAEPPAWAAYAEVSADGRRLTEVAGQDLPTYALPEGTTRVSIDVPSTNRLWHGLQGIVLVAAFVLALPLGRRRRTRAAA